MQAIYEEIGLRSPITRHSGNVSVAKGVPDTSIVISNEDQDRIMEMFKGFIRRYIRGLSDKEYLTRI